jgi:hypothetical protein
LTASSASLLKKGGLKNACGEDYDNFIIVCICINLMGVHFPELAVYWLVYPVHAIRTMAELEIRSPEDIDDI